MLMNRVLKGQIEDRAHWGRRQERDSPEETDVRDRQLGSPLKALHCIADLRSEIRFLSRNPFRTSKPRWNC